MTIKLMLGLICPTSGRGTVFGMDCIRQSVDIQARVGYLELFSDQPENLFHLEDEVKITGKIVWYQGDPVIYVTDPSQIEWVR